MISFIVEQKLSVIPEVIIIPFFKKEIDWEMIKEISGISGGLDFEANFKEVLILYHPDGSHKIFLLGLGDEEDVTKASLAFRSLAFNHYQKWKGKVAVDLSHLSARMVHHAVLGIQLAAYNPGIFKTDEEREKGFANKELSVQLIHQDSESGVFAKTGMLTAETQSNMMRLVDHPANKKTPEDLAAYALKSAKEYGYKAEIFYKNDLVREGLHTILAVGEGSDHPPVMIVLEYNGTGGFSLHPQLGLVGKGITFDTGGLSIKGSANMHYMKSDMGGAAAVMGAVELAARLELPVHVVAVIPSAENSVDARSLKPGDVIDSYSGKTIEVIDTDAEGRLVLADGLAYIIGEYEPEVLIDLATLTGSCVSTLGYVAAGMFTNNDSLAEELIQAGEQAHERMWRLPLWQDYEADVHSDVADVKNYSGKPVAGAISAAKFLEVFTNEHLRWAHLDIAGVAFGDSEFTKMKSATGYGVRLLVEFMKQLSKNYESLPRVNSFNLPKQRV